jgi:regulator of protease activity HflC (stomatin/prohibitin superfamily)
MKEWWTTKAWPWLKANWQWVLFPIGILLLVLEVLSKMRPQVVTIDPTEKADERAKIEEETRKRQLEAERARLAAEQQKIQDDAEKERQARTAAQAGEVDHLRQDPEELRRRMLDAGRRR